MSSRLALCVDRGDFRLDVDLAWDARVAVLFGPSGSGKSTLLEALLGLVPAPGATLRLGGRELAAPGRKPMPPEARGLGWVPQDSALFPHLDVAANVAFGARRAGSGGGASVARHAGGSGADLARAMAVLELEPLRHRSVSSLSGGERQRVALARALASGPHALLLDEPLASLDLPLRARVLPYLLRVRDELDLPMLYITHDPDEAMLVGETAVVLDAGRAVAAGPPREVLWSRAVLPLSEALGLENLLEARVVAGGDGEPVAGDDGELRVETTGGLRLALPAPVDLAPGSRLRLGLRAQDILLAAEPPGRISARNVLPAIVRRCEEAGDGVLVHLDAGDPLVAKLTAGAARELGLAAGTRVHLVIKAQALRRLG